jgi:hypothetical protein
MAMCVFADLGERAKKSQDTQNDIITAFRKPPKQHTNVPCAAYYIISDGGIFRNA